MPCNVCIHPDRLEIEEKILDGQLSLLKISEGYEYASHHSVTHHKLKCMPSLVKTYRTNRDISHAERMLAYVDESIEDQRLIREMALEKGELRTASLASKEASASAERFLKMTGEMPDTTNQAASPAFLRFRNAVLGVLARHPEALQDVMLALQGLEPTPQLVQSTSEPDPG